MIRPPPISSLFPYTTLFRSSLTIPPNMPCRAEPGKSGSGCHCPRSVEMSRPHAFFRNHGVRSEEHTSELQSLRHLVCRLLLEKKKKKNKENDRKYKTHKKE